MSGNAVVTWPFLNLKPRKILRIILKILVLVSFRLIFDVFQKQSFGVVLQNSCSEKFRRFHQKTSVLKACNFHKKRLQHRCFPVKFVKILRAPFFAEHLWWLLLIFLFIIVRCCHFISLLSSVM